MPVGSIIINKRSLTLIEILVSMIILALVVTGLANVFVASKRYIQHSRLRMTGGELGKYFLDPLQNDVNAGTWSSAANRLSHPPNPMQEDVDIDGKTYTGTYEITNNSPAANLNRVKVIISWPGAE